jgi:phenylalanyl-tRNA synthetase alpha chain
MKEKLHTIKEEVLLALEKVKQSEVLQNIENKYLGRKGELTKILRGMKDLDAEKRKEIGKLANDIKSELLIKVQEIKKVISKDEDTNGAVDVTLPGKKMKLGHLHPLTIIREELVELFTEMGFMTLDGPELESDFFCFEALNIPEFHPARDMQDTFYIDKENKDEGYDLVMRTHTSPMQIRAMRKYGAPLRCVVPGRVFRSEALDACHDATFDQLEGLMVGENISMSNLISILKEMLSGIFKREVKIRVRPGYFPFVEPGIEVDVNCTICNGVGCSSCKHTGWLEMIGAGMIHPKVLEHGKIDSKKYSGFAFGLGITRLAMMKYGVDDIRHFHGGDMRFLEQF